MKANALKKHETIYKNAGQQAEVNLEYTLTGNTRKADNRKGGADVGSYQVKTFRATLCKGTDVNQILIDYKEAERFAFVDNDNATWYDMSKAEFIEFVKVFAEVTRDSKKNGGTVKLRLNRKKEAQREWLTARA